MGLVKFITKTAAQYAALQSKDSDALYFITDTQKLYKGSVEYCAQGSYTPPEGSMIYAGSIELKNEGLTPPSAYKKGNVFDFTGEAGASGLFGEDVQVEPGDFVIAKRDKSSTGSFSDFIVVRNGFNVKWS